MTIKGWFSLFILGIFLFIGFACGGGGGGGGSPSVTYTGSTSQASIDGGNAEELAILAYNGTTPGASAPLTLATEAHTKEITTPAVIALTDLNRKAAEYLTDTIANTQSLSQAVTVQDSFYCYISGTVDVTLIWDAAAGTITETLTFHSCRDSNIVLDGVLIGVFTGIDSDYYGNPVLNDPVLNLNMTYRNLSMDFLDTGMKITSHGTVTTTLNASGTYPFISMTMNMAIRNDTIMRVNLVENYRMVLTDYYSYVELNIISGRVYDPDYGYIDVTTPNPIRANSSGPYQGLLRIDGADGSWAELDFSISCDSSIAVYNARYYDGTNPVTEFCCNIEP